MTLFNQSQFYVETKNIKIKDNKFNVISGANILNNLPLCSVSVDYKQYQRLSVQIPKGQTDFVLSFPMLGIKPTFICIVPKYTSLDPTYNYLKWKFQPSGDAKWSMTSILTFTGTVTNPIPPILIDNPNAESVIQIEILVSAMDNDYLNDIAAFLYLNELTFDKVHTYNETNSEILALFNSDSVLAGTVNYGDIVNVSRVIGKSRIIIDEASEDNIVLDFISEYDAAQAESAISWWMNDYQNRSLPQIADIIAPVITFKPAVSSNTLTIDLSTYLNDTVTKQDIIDLAILSVTDNIDGNMMIIPQNVSLKLSTTDINTIVSAGTYTATFTISDIAENTTTETIDIIATNVIVDTVPPVITTTSAVIGSVINTFNLSSYSGTFTYSDAKLMCLLSIVDDVDGTLPISSATVVFLDSLLTPVSSITATGNYSVIFTAADAALNETILPLTVTIV